MDPGIITREFIYDSAPFPSCHAATLLETQRGLLYGFFGGTHERHPDVCIYMSRHDGARWHAPVEVADGVQSDGSRLPTWNPVLFRPRNGPVMLFYKVGPNPREWWGMVKSSEDDGQTWSDPRRLPHGILGPIKNKPEQLDDGTIISPTSIELSADPNDDGLRAATAQAGGAVTTAAPARAAAPRPPESGWHVYFELSTDGGQTWQATPWVEQPAGVKAIQPSILVHPNNVLQAVGRTKSAKLFDVWSQDGGRTWGPLRLTALPNCNSGTDAVTLRNGKHLLVYNHSDTEKVRYPLNLAVSQDGREWLAAGVIESEPPGQYSYPAIIQTADGLVHVAYTWKRIKMRHVVVDPDKLQCRPLIEAVGPTG